jgi:hypothetical protein
VSLSLTMKHMLLTIKHTRQGLFLRGSTRERGVFYDEAHPCKNPPSTRVIGFVVFLVLARLHSLDPRLVLLVPVDCDGEPLFKWHLR